MGVWGGVTVSDFDAADKRVRCCRWYCCCCYIETKGSDQKALPRVRAHTIIENDGLMASESRLTPSKIGTASAEL